MSPIQWQVIIAGFVAAFTLMVFIINLFSRIKALEIEVAQLRENEKNTNGKFDEIMVLLRDILIKLEGKANRPQSL